MSRNADFDTPLLRQRMGSRLMSERMRLRMKRPDIWRLTGFNPDATGAYESGLARIPATYLRAMAMLGFDVQYVLTGVASRTANEAAAAVAAEQGGAPE